MHRPSFFDRYPSAVLLILLAAWFGMGIAEGLGY